MAPEVQGGIAASKVKAGVRELGSFLCEKELIFLTKFPEHIGSRGRPCSRVCSLRPQTCSAILVLLGKSSSLVTLYKRSVVYTLTLPQ